LLRARQTAEAIAGVVGVSVELDARLLDRDYGSWAGQRQRDVVARWGSVDAAPGVEDMLHVRRRATDIVYEHPLRVPTVLVTHDAILHAMLDAIGGPDTRETIDPADWFTVVQYGADLRVDGHGHS
jgi:probable phosphoglycerate mutase